MTAPALLGPSELRLLLQAVIDANPDAVNPTVRNSKRCVNTAPNGERCLVAQMGADNGLPIPPNGIATWRDWPVTVGGAVYLTDVQVVADAITFAGLPWSSITLPEVP